MKQSYELGEESRDRISVEDHRPTTTLLLSAFLDTTAFAHFITSSPLRLSTFSSSSLFSSLPSSPLFPLLLAIRSCRSTPIPVSASQSSSYSLCIRIRSRSGPTSMDPSRDWMTGNGLKLARIWRGEAAGWTGVGKVSILVAGQRTWFKVYERIQRSRESDETLDFSAHLILSWRLSSAARSREQLPRAR